MLYQNRIQYCAILHWNVAGMVDTTDEPSSLIDKFNVTVVGICEHWLKLTELSDIGLAGFKLASSYNRLSGVRGGTAIFLREDLEYVELYYLVELSMSNICEVAAVFIRD